jgi:glycerophosphoryl diester phosphodiesterase
MKKMIGLVALAVAGTVLAAKPDYATFICHRGESHDAPENTLPAYKMAVDRGFGFECDIYLSADKRVFTFHDGTLTRTTAGACKKKCAEANWAEEISKVDVGGWGKWKGSKFSPTRPALLEEVLELAVDGRQIYVEVKPGPEIVPYIKAVYEKQKKATNKNTLFICFNRETCKALKKLMPEYKVYWLTSSWLGKKKEGTAKMVTVDYVLEGLKETGADGVDCHFDPKVITADFIKAVKDKGYEFHAWTIDRLDLSLLAFERGAQTVTTNCAKKQLDEYKAR